jgi:hypothetical protein
VTTARPALIRASTASTLCLWTSRGLENLWLLTAVLVPLAFLFLVRPSPCCLLSMWVETGTSGILL